MSMSPTRDVDVLVVGAGPVGLTLAGELRRHGVSCRIIDQQPQPATSSRALGVFNRTMEAFGQMGIAEEILAGGQKAQMMNIYANGKNLAGFGFASRRYETPYESPLFCSQVEVEQVLTNHLAHFDVQVERGIELLSVAQDTNGIVANVQLNDGTESYIHARWLAGCDGGHSRVRKVLQLPFEGSPDETWMVVDVNIDWKLSKHSLHAFLSPEGTVVAFPFPEGKRWRLLETVVPDKTDPSSVAQHFTRKLNEVYRAERIVIPEPLWLSVFTIQQRHVPVMRAGRSFVVGDAAHVHSPASGQGMNTGIQDACNLAWKLALVIRGQAEETLLDSYSIERLAIATRVLNGALTFTRIIGQSSPFKQRLRNGLLQITNTIPALHRRVNQQITTMLSGLNLSYPTSHIITEDWSTTTRQGANPADSGLLPGTRVPDIQFNQAEKQGLFTLLQGTEHVGLLLTGLEPDNQDMNTIVETIEYIQHHHSQWIRLFLVTPSTEVQRELRHLGSVVLDEQHVLHRRLGAQTTTFYLLRPDGYVGYRNQPAKVDYIDHYVRNVLGIRVATTVTQGDLKS